MRPSGAVCGLTALSATLAACASAGPAALDFTRVRPAGRIAGSWVGGTDVLGGYILIEADFADDTGRVTGELRAPSENVSRLPVVDGAVTDSAVWFLFRSPFGEHRAEARWDAGMLFGRIEGGGLSGAFHLLPVRPVPDAAARVGSYAEGPAHRLLVTRRPGGGLAWAETRPLKDGALWIAGGALYGFADDTVFTDRSIRAEPRRHEWAVFGDDAIEWHPETRPVRVTRRVARPVMQQPVTFTSGDAALSGTLLLPPGDGPHPAVVLVHGSGPAERTHLLSLLRADLFLRQGIAVLLYDKRGVGASTGDWERAGIADLARDAAAGVAFARRHPAVDPRAVGLAGHSQAGWVVPAAAALEPGADFLVVLSGGGVSPHEQEMYRARTEAAAAGLPAEDAARLMDLKWAYAATGEGWDAYAAALRAADPRVVALVEAPTDPAPPLWALPRALSGYTPVPDLRAIRVPTLVVFGADDDNLPVDRAAGVWRETVPGTLLTIETIPGVGHGLVGIREGRGSIFPAALVRAFERWAAVRLGRE